MAMKVMATTLAARAPVLAAGALVLAAAALSAGYVFGTEVFMEPMATYERHVHSAGHRALFMCSAHFIARRKPEDIERWELRYAAPDFIAPGRTELEPATMSAVGVTARGLIRRRAAYEEGRGCVLLSPGAGAESLLRLGTARYGYRPEQGAAPWPRGDAPRLLNAVVDAAFDGRTYHQSDASWMPDAKTIGLVIVHHGRIVAERYAEGWDEHTQYRAYSASKSLSNLIAGARVLEGKLSIDAPVLFPEWADPDDPRRAITTRHLLNMSSGLKCDGGGTFSLDTYFAGGRNAALDAAQRPLVARPGTKWCYSNYDSISVARAVARTFVRQQDFIAYAYELLRRIGMRDTVLETDPYGNLIISSQIWTTPRDLARFGLLYLNDGICNGERVLPEGWVAFTRTPAPAPAHSMRASSTQLPTGYGAQFWLYDDRTLLPEDTFTAAGHGGQFSTIVPSRSVVIARLGLQGWKHKQFVADVLNALPEGAGAP